MTLPPCRYTETLAVPCDLEATVIVDPGVPALPSTGVDLGLAALAVGVVAAGAALLQVATRPRQRTSS